MVVYKRNGKRVTVKGFQKGNTRKGPPSVPRVAMPISDTKPLNSLGLSVHREQAAEFNALYKERGITGAHHEANGDCVITSKKARNQVLKARGMRDNDAGYGDHAGEN